MALVFAYISLTMPEGLCCTQRPSCEILPQVVCVVRILLNLLSRLIKGLSSS